MALQPESCNAGRLTHDSFGLVPVRSPLLGESRLIYFPEGTEMFQFPSFATSGLCIQPEVIPTFLGIGFPIRKSTDQRLLTAPRGLSQFCHVLHRLLVPRHPPNALTSLTTENRYILSISCETARTRRQTVKSRSSFAMIGGRVNPRRPFEYPRRKRRRWSSSHELPGRPLGSHAM